MGGAWPLARFLPGMLRCGDCSSLPALVVLGEGGGGLRLLCYLLCGACLAVCCLLSMRVVARVARRSRARRRFCSLLISYVNPSLASAPHNDDDDDDDDDDDGDEHRRG